MTSGVRSKSNLAAFNKRVASLAKQRVLVGIPGDQSKRTDANGNTEPINNAALGYIHEHGSPANNIPARPFLSPGVKDAMPTVKPYLKSAAAGALKGDAAATDKGFNAAGLIATSAVKAKMSEGPFEPLADATIEARERRGVTRTNPLIDTANLQAHITYVIRK